MGPRPARDQTSPTGNRWRWRICTSSLQTRCEGDLRAGRGRRRFLHAEVWPVTRARQQFATSTPSIWRGGTNLFWDRKTGSSLEVFSGNSLGGLIKYSRELCYFFCTDDQRLQNDSRPRVGAPTQAGLVDGQSDEPDSGLSVMAISLRIEKTACRAATAKPVPGLCGRTIAAGMGPEWKRNLDCGESYEGNAYIDAKPALAFPRTLR